MNPKHHSPSTVPVLARVSAVKIHGPHSDQPTGTRETLESGGPRLVEITKEQAVELFGQEAAEKLFEGVEEV
jgi:hypothetical protein